MGEKRPPGLSGRTDLQAALVSCAGVAAMACAALAAFALLPPGAAQAAVACTAAALCVGVWAAARFWFRRISNPSFRDLSNTDRLTGLKNRNAYETDLCNLHAGQGFRSAGILLMDLDNLKGVNDRLGHTAGDDYLRQAAEALRRACGAACTGYRVGGDEFVLLAQQAREEELAALAEQALEVFSAHRPAWPVALSLSVGWACFDAACDRNLYDTYERADQRMYRQKREKRGRG